MKKTRPVFDPVLARAIGRRRLIRAAREFCREHKWKLVRGAIYTRKGTWVSTGYEALGEMLLRSGGLTKVRNGYADGYTGKVYGAAKKAA